MLHSNALSGNARFAPKDIRGADNVLIDNIFFVNHLSLLLIEWWVPLSMRYPFT